MIRSLKRRFALLLKLRLALLLIPAATILQPRSASSQWVLQSGKMDIKIRKGIELIYNMDFDQASRVFEEVIAENPEHPAGYFYRATVEFWRAVTNPDNTKYDETYRMWLQRAIDRSDSLLAQNSSDIAGIFYKGASLGMRARIFAIRPNWKEALKLMLGDAKEGVRYLNQIEEIIPSNSDVLFGRGLYNYYVEAVKEDNPLLAPIIGLFATGNKRVGLQMLEEAARTAVYAKTESQYELMKIYYIYEKNYVRANAFAQYLTNKYPNNVQFLHYLGFSQINLGLTRQYDSTYHVILTRSRARKEGYTIRQAREAMHFIGQAALLLPEGSIDSALYYLYNADLLSRKISPEQQDWWIVREELMLGQAYDAKGYRKRAVEMYRRVLDMDNVGSSHNDAERYLSTPYRK